MSAPWIVRKAAPLTGLIRVHLTRDVFGQQENILMNVCPRSFGEEFMEGDTRGPDLQLIHRAGANGTNPSGLSQKT